MVLRVLHFLIGALLAGGGGYLAWTYRDGAAHIFPPGAEGLPVLLLAGLLGLTSGVVFLVSALHPRPNQRRLRAEKAAREEAALGQAEAYYSARARAADRTWRSGDITPPAPPVAPPITVAPPVAPSAAAPLSAPPEPVETPAAEPLPQPRGQRSLSMPPSPAAPAAPAPAPQAASPALTAKPVATAAATPAQPSPFPTQATLTPIPRASDPPPAPVQAAAPTAPASPVTADDPHAHIRAAIHAGQLDEADRMLAAARDNATGMELALLTALAGDHAAVSGRQSHAKWLWRLALKRFGELDAMNSPAAKSVAESLRQAG